MKVQLCPLLAALSHHQPSHQNTDLFQIKISLWKIRRANKDSFPSDAVEDCLNGAYPGQDM